MAFTLSETDVARMIDFVDVRLRRDGCDHTHRFTSEWSEHYGVNWDDLLDALEQHGAFCDCEVPLNLQGSTLSFQTEVPSLEAENRWLLPPNFAQTLTETNRVLIARAGIGKNNYAADGEWLVPAPLDAKPRKRVRKSVHFFIGLQTGMPTEIGFVQELPPISLPELTRRTRESTVPELADCDGRLAAFVAQEIAKFPNDAAAGTNVMDRVGIASKHKELTIHRVILCQ